MMLADVISAAQLLFSIFVSDLLPVFAIAGIGFVLARFAGVQVQPVSRLTFHALAPALVFNILATSTADSGQVGRMTLFYALVAISAATMARLVAIPLRLDRRGLTAFLLVVICSNSGNYGLPVTLLAFGRDALTFASVYFVASSMFTYTGGVFLAASGKRSVRDALTGVARIPAVYGAAAALVTLSLGVRPPGVVMSPVTLLSDAAVPMMILVLGMQLERASWPERPGVVAAAVLVSLVLTPLMALGIAHLAGLQGDALRAGVLQTSMPTAVITTILAVEFDVHPDFVTSVVFVGTLLSPLTVTLMIAYLQTV
jgi:predicted permease